MKKFFTTLFVVITCMNISFAQMTGELITGTLKAGSTPSSVIVALKSSTTFTGQLTNVQFTFQVPNTVTPQPTVTIKSNPLNAYIPTANYLTLVSDENGYFNYLFAATTVGSPTYNFIAGQEFNALEVDFSGGGPQNYEVRLAQVPNGGLSSQLNFYIEISGNDNTNATSPFYGAQVVNSTLPPYTGYSYVIYTAGVVPVKLTNFSAVKKNNDAILNWQVTNQDANSNYFELERSFNGTDFSKVGRVDVNLNSGLSGSYAFTDVNAAALRSNVLYYRLKMVDKDNTVTYSTIKNIRLTSKAFSVNVYPNPARQFSIVNIELENESSIILNLTDASGKVLQKTQFNGFKGLNQKQIDVSKFASGSYLLKVNSGNETQTISILKE
ncbi:MAG: T9SS type A sorting domain-containing protein [Ginsengibacter sp.]